VDAVTRPHGGVHSVLAADHPYVFVDSCMQMWPDADFAVAHRHGVTAYGVTAFDPHDTFDTAIERLMYWHLIARRHPNLVVATSADEIRDAKRDGRAALLLFSQGGDWIERKLHRLEAMYRLGLRVVIPAYNRSNQICDGLLDRTDMGLTRFGRLVVEECNRLGLLLDCTHVGKRATLEIIAHSTQPVIFSHSNPSRLVPNPRNIDDEQIAACTARGGIIGLVAWGPLVMRPGTTHWPTLDEFIAIVEDTAQRLGGTAAIGLATDMSLGTYPSHDADPWGEPGYPNIAEEYGRHVTPDQRSHRRALDGFHDYPQVVDLANRLLSRGFSDGDVRGILGENYLRLFAQVWNPLPPPAR
jgi:membrane dipeptidase